MLSKKMNAETKARRSNLLWMLASVSLLVVIGLENILSSTFVLDEGASLSGYLGKQLGFFSCRRRHCPGHLEAGVSVYSPLVQQNCPNQYRLPHRCQIRRHYGQRRSPLVGLRCLFLSAFGVCQVSGDYHDGCGHCLLFGTTWE